MCIIFVGGGTQREGKRQREITSGICFHTQSLRAVRVLFSPIVSTWVDGCAHLSPCVIDLEFENIVQTISQKL